MIFVLYYGDMFRPIFRPFSGQPTYVKLQSVLTMYYGIPYHLQGVRESN